MKQTTLIFIFSLWCAMGWGQVTTTPTVIASTGKYAGSPGQLEVSYTIGEMTAVTTVGNTGGLQLTQGFHQPEEIEITTGLTEQTSSPINFVLYPNPASSSIEISYQMPKAGKAVTIVTDISGRRLQANEQNYTGGKATGHLDVSSLASGSYLLTLQFTTGSGQKYLSTKSFSIIH